VAGLVADGDTVENVEFSGARVVDQNGAGIRAEGTNLTIRHSYFHDNENGILGGKGHVRIEYSEFFNNGFGDGYTHNMYIANCDTFSLSYSYSHHAKIGHEIKSRAKVNYILYNRIMNENDGTASYEVDLPNGGDSYLIGNVIQQSVTTDNPTIVSYGEEGLSNSNTNIYLINNTFINDLTSGTFIRLASGSMGHVTNNLYFGTGSWISGVADTTNNLKGSSNDVVSLQSYDVHLQSASSARNAGVNPGLAGSFSLTPIWEYGSQLTRVNRNTDGVLDAGAFEFGSASSGIGSRIMHKQANVPMLRWNSSLSGIGVDGARRSAVVMPLFL